MCSVFILSGLKKGAMLKGNFHAVKFVSPVKDRERNTFVAEDWSELLTFVLVVDRCSSSFWRELIEDRSGKYEFICCI